MSTVRLQAIQRNIEVTRGTDTPILFTLQLDDDGQPVEAGGTPVDLTGDSVRFVVKLTPGTEAALIDITQGVHVDDAEGETSVTVADTDTEPLLTFGVSHVSLAYELRLVTAGGAERVFFTGTFRIVDTARAPGLG